MSSFAQSVPSAARSEQAPGNRNNDRRRQNRKPRPDGDANPSSGQQGNQSRLVVDMSGGDSNGAAQNKKPRNRRGKRNSTPTTELGADNGAVSSAPMGGSARAENPQKKHRGDLDSKPAAAGVAMDVVQESAPSKPPADGVLAAYMTNEKFSSLNICAESKRAIAEVLKFETMTHVQATCIGPIQKGLDCLAKSKTGTGKTLAFLIPAVESIRNQPKAHVSILVLSPTRELANQIATEARALLTFHAGSKVVVFVGGTNVNADKRAISGAVTVLVATPGRLIDHLQSTPGFANSLANIKVLVMDEADRLLDMGFKPAIDQILRSLPPKGNRQTLLFSATIPPAVVTIARNALRPGYATIDTTGLAEDDSGSTHLHVHQEIVVAPFDQFIYAVAAALTEQMNNSPDGYKILVFFTTARVTGYMAELFAAAGLNIVEMHSRKSQSYREKASEKFRAGKNILMFSSDVTARGLDYPGVTFVLQVGITDKEQYIHRLGRTARAGKEGKGMIILSDFEERHMTRELKDLPLHRVALERLRPSMDLCRAHFTTVLVNTQRNPEFIRSAEQAYIAWLGFYNSHLRKIGFDKPVLVQMANQFAQAVMQLAQQPAIQKKTVGKMGLKGVPGLRLE